MPAKRTIEEMREIAASRGGKCLSPVYRNSRTALSWQCQKGHVWSAQPAAIKNGKTWCPDCANAPKFDIAEMQQLAAMHGGKCLSKKYVNAKTKLTWQCAVGHVWEASPGNVKNHGTWCTKCLYESKRKSISDMHELAAKYNGKFLSKIYTYTRSKYRWQCADGHKWQATADSVNRGSWCPQCANNLQERMCRAYFESIFDAPFPTRRPKWLRNEWGNQMELDGFNEELKLAFEYNGKQHYKLLPIFQKSEEAFDRLRSSDRTKKELCKRNEISLVIIPYTVSSDELGAFIASQCQKLGFAIPKGWRSGNVDLSSAYSPKRLQFLQELAESRGGRCLSDHYLGMVALHDWECEHGHRWPARPDGIAHGSWCPTCSGRTSPTLDEIQNLAKSRGGTCLSNTYVNNRTKLRWRCAKGHEWSAPYDGIQQGGWCPDCGGSKPKTLDDMHQLAARRGGKCLSKNYVNVSTKMTWQCAVGHKWHAVPNNIQQGKWCPKCGDTKLSIEKMQQLAEQQGGRCLSKKYTNNHTPLKWECERGHRWKCQPSSVIAGNWCRECTHQRRRKTIQDMQCLAAEKGGVCLSAEYVNVMTSLEWQCAKGHRWLAKPNNVQQGKWCKKCYHESRRKSAH